MKNSTTKLSEFLHQDRLPFKQTKDQAWQNVSARLEEAKVIDLRQNPLRPWMKYAAAAVVAAVISLGAVSYFGQNEFVNTEAYVQTVYFADGSSVNVKPDGQVAYNSFLWMWTRSVHMKGESFFEVEPGNTFTVYTERGEVQVLGTSFNVRAADDAFDVQCKTGKVAVNSRSGESVVLKPGAAYRNTGVQSEIYVIPVQRMGAWINGPYQFEEESLTHVLSEIAADFEYDLDIRSDTELKFTGSFSREEELIDMIEIVCKPLGLEFHVDEDKRLISILK